jgi:hypothetical protein
VPRPSLNDRRLLAAMLAAPAVTDVTARVAALATDHFRRHGEDLVAYCRCYLDEGDSPERLREFLLEGNTVIYVPEPGDGPMFVILGTMFMGDPPEELGTPAAAADAEAIIEMGRG